LISDEEDKLDKIINGMEPDFGDMVSYSLDINSRMLLKGFSF
jgi:hypothetical protein